MSRSALLNCCLSIVVVGEHKDQICLSTVLSRPERLRKATTAGPPISLPLVGFAIRHNASYDARSRGLLGMKTYEEEEDIFFETVALQGTLFHTFQRMYTDPR